MTIQSIRRRTGDEAETAEPIGDDQMHRETQRVADCGWGRVLYSPRFDDVSMLVHELKNELEGCRDIAIRVDEPQVAIALAPDAVFVDPSFLFRLSLADPACEPPTLDGVTLRTLRADDADGVNRLYEQCGMVPTPPGFLAEHVDDADRLYLVAEDRHGGRVLGTVTGLDHGVAFGDPARGASFWCLAVDPQAPYPGIGQALVQRLVVAFAERGNRSLELSVMHDNTQAIALYEKLGFERVHTFSLKCRNRINEPLFVSETPGAGLNPYASLIVDEARRRGIRVDVQDADSGLFRLERGGRSVRCRESLTELASAIAMAICDDKRLSRRIVSSAGVRVPEMLSADEVDDDRLAEFIETHGSVVVKPARGEQGDGVSVGLDTLDAVRTAIESARAVAEDVLIEACARGEDLRLIVIDYKLVAAAVRRPASVTGDGTRSVRALIEAQSRRRAAATGGESSIPLDDETERTIASAGYRLDSVPDAGETIAVRGTANLHTGGTMHDVTEALHPTLVDAAVRVARAIDIPVVGVDLMVPSPTGPDYVFIEANERPGLANHEPQPTAARFVDLLFPVYGQR